MLGMQVVFVQFPPTFDFSTTATRLPRLAAVTAETIPAIPAPMTIRSKS
ncbi:MAG TPA: hypothetical protein PKJ38_15655 [Planctomycetota bacterium]|nr:hypothetical protein [Planctomycetota bacterium]